MKVGVLGLQGGVYEHVYMLRKAMSEEGLNGEAVVVKKPSHLQGLDGIVIPGGESTAIGALARRVGLLDPLRDSIKEGLPAFGTCAGAILLAEKVTDRVVGGKSQPLIGVMSIEVVRNYFGRQRESFEVDLEVEGVNGRFRGVFIRAPAITKAWGSARIISRLQVDGEVVGAAAAQGANLATAFHPELTGDTRLHRLWLRGLKR